MSKDAAEKILSTANGLQSTVQVRAMGLKLEFCVSGKEALKFLRANVALPRLDRSKTQVRYIKLQMPLHEAQEVVKEFYDSRQGMLAEDGKTHIRIGTRYDLSLRRCFAYQNVTHKKPLPGSGEFRVSEASKALGTVKEQQYTPLRPPLKAAASSLNG